MTARFSIIVPTHRRPEAIARCVDSLSSLEYPRDSFEVIVVEDGGSSEALHALRGADWRGLTVRWLHQPRRGPAAARNLGARHARYEHLAFTDDDCRPRPDWLERLADAFEEAPAAVHGGHTANGVEGNSYSSASQALVTHLVEWGQANGAPFFASNNLALPKGLFERMGGFDMRFARAGGEDRDLSDRLNNDGVEQRYVPSALVDHFHVLGLRSFWSQHYRYGRAARTYHEIRRTGAVGELTPPHFYKGLLHSPFRGVSADVQPVRVFGLLLASQFANALGYFAAGGARRAMAGESDGASSSPGPVVAHHALRTGTAVVIGSGARYAAALLAARALGASGFGVYMLAMAITSLMSILGAVGLSPGVLPVLARAREEGSDKGVRAVVGASLAVSLAVSLGLAVVLFAAAGPLATNVFDDAAIAPALRMFAGVVVLGSLVGVSRSLLHGLDAIWQQQWFERVLAVLVTCGVLAATWVLGLGMAGAAAASYLGLGAALVCALLLLRARLPRGISGETPRGLTTVLIRQSWPLMGTTMLTFVLLWSDVILMGCFGESESVGVYGAAARLAAVGLLAQEALGPILLALAAGFHVKRDHAALSRLYQLTVRWSVGPGLVVLAALFVWAPRWLALFGPQFEAGATPLRILIMGKAISVLCGMPGRVYAVTGLQRRHLLNMVVLVVGNIGLNCLWIPRHGMLGAAAATAVSLGAVRIFQLFELGRVRGLWPWQRQSFGLVAGLLALTGGAWLLRDVGIETMKSCAWLGPCAAFLAVCFAFLVKVAFGREDRALWARFRGRSGEA